MDNTENLYRTIRLTAHFTSNADPTPTIAFDGDDEDEFSQIERKQYKFTPQPEEFEAVDDYIKKCKKEIIKIDLLKTVKNRNVNIRELQAIRSL